MYIDSPDFPRRKVAIRQQNLPGSYVYGLEREKLANYVAEALNDDANKNADILEKFRKQAQEYRSKWLRKNHPGGIKNFREVEQDKLPNLEKAGNNTIGQSNLPYSRGTLLNDKEVQEQDERPSGVSKGVQKIVLREIGVMHDPAYQQILRSLRERDKKIKRQGVLIKKNEERMKKMQRRIMKLQIGNQERERILSEKQYKQSYDRIRGLLHSVSDKLVKNQELLTSEMFLSNHRSKIYLQNNPQEKSIKGLNIPLSESRHYPQIKKGSSSFEGVRPKVSYSDLVVGRNVSSYVKGLDKGRNRLDGYSDIFGG